jgi:sigma-E factor negative regulatory protein RseA
MKAKISALMDGELDERAARQAIDALSREDEAVEAWRTYHLISDTMRDSGPLSDGFAARLGARLAGEPTVLAPTRQAGEPRSWHLLPAAASVAAVALVGWLAFAPQQEGGQTSPPPPLAQAPAADPRPVVIPLSSAANDYLLAHQGFSPRISIQGMAPYVRTVSDEQREAGR